MTKNEFINQFWRQYISIEKDFIETSDYVAVDKKNYDTFSNEYAKLLVVICSELDSLSEAFSKIVKDDYQEESSVKSNNIIKRIDTIKTAYPQMEYYRVSTISPFIELNFVPFNKFSQEETSNWWKDYNDLKHRRFDMKTSNKYYYENGNLKNVLSALAGLYLLCYLVGNYYDETDSILMTESKLFAFIG